MLTYPVVLLYSILYQSPDSPIMVTFEPFAALPIMLALLFALDRIFSRLVELLTESASNPAYSEPTAPFSCRVQRLSEASSEYSVLRYGEIYAGSCRPSTQMVKSFSFAVLLRAGQPVERYVLRLRRLLI